MFVKTAQTQTAHAQSFAEAKRSQFTETTLQTIERQRGARPFEMTKSQRNFNAAELRGAKNVALQQMEQDGMASENPKIMAISAPPPSAKPSRIRVLPPSPPPPAVPQS